MNENRITIAQWIGICGCSVAASISWSTNYSLPWAIVHSICGWFYVLYYALTN
jgi:hypothetical protein